MRLRDVVRRYLDALDAYREANDEHGIPMVEYDYQQYLTNLAPLDAAEVALRNAVAEEVT